MSWNRPENNAPREDVSKRKQPALLKGIVGGLIVALGGIVCFFIFSGNDSTSKEDVAKTRSGIKEVKPAIPKRVVETNVEEVAKSEPAKTNKSTIGMVIKTPTGKTYTIVREIKHDFLYRHNGVEVRDRDIFHHDSERILDAILCCEPGDRFYATFNEDAFRKDLTQALVEKIEFSEEDDDRERERKQAVIDAKEELRQALKRGEDPVQIVADARKDVMKVADMRDNILNSLAEVRRNAQSEEEVNDYIAAANKMMEPYGVKPILTRAEKKERVQRAVLKRKLMKENKQ